ncbi:hypothetical protein [Xanthobacter versatilis]|uniref:hypothetical protein n=1 Tax=Xanthobacter autotrophicus (strain ATCC BAA-1158 / Py2) TaxID=78245 RepID=UPI003726A821
MSGDLTLRDAITLLGGNEPTREGRLAGAARRAGISFSQAKRIFYGETTDPKTSVRERIMHAVQNLNQKAEADARNAAARTADVGELVARAVDLDANLRREVLALVLRRLAGDRSEDSPLD